MAFLHWSGTEQVLEVDCFRDRGFLEMLLDTDSFFQFLADVNRFEKNRTRAMSKLYKDKTGKKISVAIVRHADIPLPLFQMR